MDSKNKNILFYGGLAIAIIAVLSIYLYLHTSAVYNVAVSITPINPQAQYYPYQTSYFNITVYNKGGNAVSGMTVNLYANNSVADSYKVSLPPHEQASITANYTYVSPGKYTFQAVADPAKLLNLQNRSAAQASVSAVIAPAAVPDVYTSIPNNGINYTQTFTLSSGGMALAAFLSEHYNISIFNNVIGIPSSMSSALFSDLHSLVVNANGAFAVYGNGTKAYSLWLQGYLNNQTVESILGTFRVRSSNASINGMPVALYFSNNKTSVCAAYSDGWTKIVSYYNNSLPGTCLSIMSVNHNSTESAFFITKLKNDTLLTHYQSGFVYKNSSPLGSVLLSTDSGKGIGFANLFEEAPYGLFVSYMLKNPAPANLSSNLTCMGLIYHNNSNNICSAVVTAKPGSNSTFSLVNTSEVLKNYTIAFYSLVNTTNLLNAHYNGAHLISALGINESSENWTTAFKNTCSLNNASINCKIVNFDYSNNTAKVSITNGFPSQMRINTAACYLPGMELNSTIGLNIAPSNSLTFSLPCHFISVPITSAMTSYILVMNYTLLNKSRIAVGTLNVSNFV
jgi:hypothetical protein